MIESNPDSYDDYPIDASIDDLDNVEQPPLTEDGYVDHGIYPEHDDYTVRVNAPGEPRELTPQMARSMEIEEQAESALWHIIRNADEDFSLPVEYPELADKPDDEPVRLLFNRENMSPNVIMAHSLEELEDIALAVIRKISPDNTVSDRQKVAITESIFHERSHIAGYEIGAATKDIQTGFWISKKPDIVVGSPSGKLLDYSGIFNAYPFTAATDARTTKLGNAVITVAPITRNFRMPGQAEQYLSEGDVARLHSMGYTSLDDIAARIEAHNDKNPARPLPPLDFDT
jgi:hypothetical protein